MYSIKSVIFGGFLLANLIVLSFAQSKGALSSVYGRISNMPNSGIHVAAAATQASCIRQCVDFKKNYKEYPFEDCFAYNYNFDQFTCELIHSIAPLNYLVSIRSRWKTGLKFEQ